MATVSNKDPKSVASQPVHAPASDRRPAENEPSEAAVVAEAAAIYPDTFDTAPSADEIAAEAYAIYLSRGGEDGRDQDDWYEAVRRLQDRRGDR
jgi:hypothetical protein